MTDRTLSCEEVLAHLLAYLDRELDATTSADIDRHLEACRGCFSRAEFEKKLKAHVQRSGTRAAPARLRTRIRQLLDKF